MVINQAVKEALKSNIGKRLTIIEMRGEPQYSGKSGIVEFVDDAGQMHGTWGGCAIIPGEDSYTIEEVDNDNP